jgi:hypothetical protein
MLLHCAQVNGLQHFYVSEVETRVFWSGMGKSEAKCSKRPSSLENKNMDL